MALIAGLKWFVAFQACAMSVMMFMPTMALASQSPTPGETGTPLHSAARNDALDAIAALLAANVDINASDASGARPLHWAAQANAAAAIGTLVEAGADINAFDDSGKTALHWAAQANAAAAIGALVEAGATVTGSAPGPSDLSTAAAQPPLTDVAVPPAQSADQRSFDAHQLYNHGEQEFVRGDFSKSRPWYLDATRADPDWHTPFFRLALVALNENELPQAKEYLHRVIRLAPHSPEAVHAAELLPLLPDH